ncbi:B3 domain-containing protein Os07g0563300-like [Humulus lupulus]|uniref:B3 domain-containing protein Os07g0563300-like n=1 Tax=Humulus lupulus TaxID=3486 RepID=UPI002B40F7AD|nr:B3 domain-containing protein Os07g0563300-like [Humulus lupulus]
MEVEQSIDSGEVISGMMAPHDYSMNHHHHHHHLLHNEAIMQAASPGTVPQLHSIVTDTRYEIRTISMESEIVPYDFFAAEQTNQENGSGNMISNPPNLPDLNAEEGNQTYQENISGSVSAAQAQNVPNVGDEGANQISQVNASLDINLRPPNASNMIDADLNMIPEDYYLVPLFEKLLSDTDTDPKLAHLVLPKRSAETYFPAVADGQGYAINIQDMEGNDWQFHYRFWLNNHNKMYILEGMKQYMSSVNWQAGDSVAFYRKEPQGTLVIETKTGAYGASGASGAPASANS